MASISKPSPSIDINDKSQLPTKPTPSNLVHGTCNVDVSVDATIPCPPIRDPKIIYVPIVIPIWKKLYITIIITISIVATLTYTTTLILRSILRPTPPQFSLQGATVNTFSLSASNRLTSNLQITLSSRNPNGRIHIYCDKLEIRISYRGQQITPTTRLSPTYQGHKDTTVWSPNLCADAVPLPPYLAVSLNQEQMVGRVLINVKVSAKVRWRVVKFISGTYHLHVDCPAYINFSNQNGSFNAVGNIQFTNCHF